jgi:hypothetical protein
MEPKMHFDLPDQDQPGDREEALAREAFALELATHINRYPARHVPLYQRVRNLTCVSGDELDRLVPAVDYFLGLYDRQPRNGRVA